MAFHEDVHAVAASLPPAEIPNASEVPAIVASVVKVLEHAGVSVAEELLPKPADPVVEAAATIAGDEATSGLEELVHRAETALEQLRQHQAQHPAEPVPTPEAPPEPAA